MSVRADKSPYLIVTPQGPRLPILISVPHSGTAFPSDHLYPVKREFQSQQPDTDWLVHKLYGFAPEMGITLIHARYSRYLIDLNRDPAGAALYNDGRKETALVPRLTFAGVPIYEGNPPDAREVARRVESYHTPYYEAIDRLLTDLRREHRHVLFYDAHSIKRIVQSISAEPFPDLILGSKDSASAAAPLIRSALETLAAGNHFEVSHNKPFKGGQLTRHFGRPGRGIHALQLEMAQDIYLDEANLCLHPVLAPRIQGVLKQTLTGLAKTLGELP